MFFCLLPFSHTSEMMTKPRAALENCLKLARDPILMANFGPTENRRLQLVQREAVAAGISF